MSQTAAHLMDHVIPYVLVRQWALSLPIALRLLLGAQPELVTPVLQLVQGGDKDKVKPGILTGNAMRLPGPGQPAAA